MTKKLPTIHENGTYEEDGKTYYLTDIKGTGMISNTGMYRLDVTIASIPSSVAAELYLRLKDAAIAFLLEKGVVPPDSISVKIDPQPTQKFDG